MEGHGRIPIQVDFSSKKGWLNPSTVVDHFGSWNNAIIAAGFAPNSASIGYVCYAKDGHLCRSYSELIIDDWLTDNGIEHEKEVNYPGSKLIADWRIGREFVEYLGIDMERDNKISQNYIKTLERKRRICAEHGLILTELTLAKPDTLRRKILDRLG
ncbi:MAG: hypothetical protein IBX64_01345 [Actinobacteria bacterium]|nr:hypothetical protein [Actinomycetota bacterium]